MLPRLMTLTEVADALRMSPRKVRDLPIPFARIGKSRRYTARDVEAYVRGATCQSTNEPAHRSGKRSSLSKGVGFAKALELRPVARQKPTSVAGGRKSASKSRQALRLVD